MSFWPCSSNTHEGLVKNLRRTGVIQHDEVNDAMLKIDRANYMAQMETPDGGPIGELASYADSPHPIGYNQTISAPHMHAHALELAYAAVKDVSRPRILDIGAGSGYLTACFGRLVEKQHGRVFGVEIISGLAQFAKKNIQLADGDLVDNGVVSVHCCNGCDGLSSESPFHFIHVGAAADVAPQALLDQLADGGRLVIPLDQDRGGQMLVEITRHGNVFSQRKLMGVCYVPLVRGRKSSV
jgi:protein-L-isoaspartate(D-aspartate) O-methyltransferase